MNDTLHLWFMYWRNHYSRPRFSPYTYLKLKTILISAFTSKVLIFLPSTQFLSNLFCPDISHIYRSRFRALVPERFFLNSRLSSSLNIVETFFNSHLTSRSLWSDLFPLLCRLPNWRKSVFNNCPFVYSTTQ